ncbi:Holliday junction resolvase RuvX [uncultured Acetobacteroides sp.]|uniref:Holliday junction resolvase RuvX n=1 Tax=uncultured Acetobacteroides sp. TaxID=1760811 RepID=UPI0029F48B9C|nr:Holliday junction resolvase RuvX [uncultured Acetobacteroides sp.]
MGRLLAIDYGKKRVGIAVTDPMQLIATGLCTVASNQVITFLKEYLGKESVDCIVIGLPKQMDNSESESMVYIKPFLKQLAKHFPQIKVEAYDERFTSKIAHQAILDGGVKKMDRRDKSLVDMVSATIILQSYMQSKELRKF